MIGRGYERRAEASKGAMANQVLMPPETETTENSEAPRPSAPHARPAHSVYRGEVELRWETATAKEPSLWDSLVANVRDAFSKDTRPALELTSKPVEGLGEEVGKTKWSRGAIIGAVVINALMITLMVVLAIRKIVQVVNKPATTENVELTDYKMPQPVGKPGGGGGGGGEHNPIPPPKGKLPDIAKVTITPPTVRPPEVQPKLAVTPTINIDKAPPPMNLPNIGVPNGALSSAMSNGSGSGAGIGSGSGGGIGSGNGQGLGPGSGHGTGGGVYRPGNGVSEPQLVYSIEPEFSDEARKAHYEGTVLVQIIVGPDGLPHNVKVVRQLGMGLDEKAVEAVKQYKFKPGLKDGKPVPVIMTVEVTFHIY